MPRTPLLAAAFMLIGVAASHAQGAPEEPPPPPPGPGVEMPHPPMGGPGGFMAMREHHMMMERAAGFRFRKDGAEIDIRCAANEPTRACVDAASVLIDKIAAVSAGK